MYLPLLAAIAVAEVMDGTPLCLAWSMTTIEWQRPYQTYARGKLVASSGSSRRCGRPLPWRDESARTLARCVTIHDSEERILRSGCHYFLLRLLFLEAFDYTPSVPMTTRPSRTLRSGKRYRLASPGRPAKKRRVVKHDLPRAEDTTDASLCDAVTRPQPTTTGEKVQSFFVVGGGSDDANQLGSAQGDDNADKETEVKPFFLAGLPSSVKQVAAGGLHSVFLTTDGRVFTMGGSDDGVLGRDESVHESVPGEVKGFVDPDGTVEDGTIIRIGAGNSHTLCLAKSGNVYQFGMMRGDDVRSRGVDRGRIPIDRLLRQVSHTHSLSNTR